MRRPTGAGCDVIVCSDLRTGARGITTQPTTLEETSSEVGIPTDENSVPITTPRLHISFALSPSRRSTTNGLTWPPA